MTRRRAAQATRRQWLVLSAVRSGTRLAWPALLVLPAASMLLSWWLRLL